MHARMLEEGCLMVDWLREVWPADYFHMWGTKMLCMQLHRDCVMTYRIRFNDNVHVITHEHTRVS